MPKQTYYRHVNKLTVKKDSLTSLVTNKQRTKGKWHNEHNMYNEKKI